METIHPAMGNFHYKNEEEIRKYCSDISSQLKQKGSLVLPEIKGKPEIINVTNEVHHSKMAPMVVCKSGLM